MVSRRDNGVPHLVTSFMHAFFSQGKDISNKRVQHVLCSATVFGSIPPSCSTQMFYPEHELVRVVNLHPTSVTSDLLFFILNSTINFKTILHPTVGNE